MLNEGQRGFLEAHRARLLDAAAGPVAPYPDGTRVAVDVNGERHLGDVHYPVLSREGQALAYAWRPDVASLVGHPWRGSYVGEGEADRILITPAAKVAPTLAGPEIGAPGPGEALTFGSLVALAHPDNGERVEATVLRALGGGDSIVYQVQPHTLGDTEALTVAADQVALVRGTWWPTGAALVAARQSAGLPVVAGEILPGAATDPQLTFFAPDSPDRSHRQVAAPDVTADQQRSALLVGLDPVPKLVTVDIHGELARVGDPGHGWLVVPAERLFTAMAKPPEQLRAIMASHAPGVALDGHEAVPTLAALASQHAPDRLDDLTAGASNKATEAAVRHLRVVPDNHAGL